MKIQSSYLFDLYEEAIRASEEIETFTIWTLEASGDKKFIAKHVQSNFFKTKPFLYFELSNLYNIRNYLQRFFVNLEEIDMCIECKPNQNSGFLTVSKDDVIEDYIHQEIYESNTLDFTYKICTDLKYSTSIGKIVSSPCEITTIDEGFIELYTLKDCDVSMNILGDFSLEVVDDSFICSMNESKKIIHRHKKEYVYLKLKILKKFERV